MKIKYECYVLQVELGLIMTLWITEHSGAMSLMHRPFKILFNDDDLDDDDKGF